MKYGSLSIGWSQQNLWYIALGSKVIFNHFLSFKTAFDKLREVKGLKREDI